MTRSTLSALNYVLWLLKRTGHLGTNVRAFVDKCCPRHVRSVGAIEVVICYKSGTSEERKNRVPGGYTGTYADCQLEEVGLERYPDVRNQSVVRALPCPLK